MKRHYKIESDRACKQGGFINHPAYAGILTEEVRTQLQQEIHKVLKNPSVVGKAILANFKTQLNQIDGRLDKGDYFGASKEYGELALGLMPENDLLVLLLKVNLIGHTDYDYIRGAKHFRNILSKDLIEIFSEDFNNLDNLDSYWGEVADFRVRGYARDALLLAIKDK